MCCGFVIECLFFSVFVRCYVVVVVLLFASFVHSSIVVFFFCFFFFSRVDYQCFFFFVASSMEAVQSEDGTQANTHTHTCLGKNLTRFFSFLKLGVEF